MSTVVWEGGVETLQPTDVFVFGSNGTGFHGAGTAGFVMRGDSRNNWREDAGFLAAMKSPVGSQLRLGRRAEFGVARGFQQGNEGCSYAIQTVRKPGARRSITRREIYCQLVELWHWAEANQEYSVLVTAVGTGYAGYTREEMQEVWDYLVKTHGLPSNVRFVGRHGVRGT